MNLFALLSLLSAVCMFFLGNFVYYQNKRNKINIVFALYCLCMSYTAFCEFMYRQAENREIAFWWLKVSFLWPFSLAFLIHFTLLFINYQNLLKRKLIYFLMYLPMLLFSIGVLLFCEPLKEFWGYTYEKSQVMTIIGVIGGCYGIIATLLTLIFYFTGSDPKKKRQTKYIFLGQLFPMFIPLLFQNLFPALHIQIPDAIVSSNSIFAFFTGYAIWKYELFVIDPATTAENIISTMPDSLILMNMDFKLLEANQSFFSLLGYEKKELIGKRIDILFEPNDTFREKIREELWRQGVIHHLEINCRTKTGVNIPIFFTGSLIKDEQGDMVGIVGIGSDCRGIKQLQAQLFQTEKMAAIGQLAGGLAHEINNPVGVILGFAQSISKRITEDHPLYLPLTSIEREAMRCKKLVGNLLSFSRSGASHPEVIDINQAIDQTLSLIELQTKMKGIEVIRTYDSSLPQLIASKSQIQQVILNLCNNAIDAMPEGGKITIITKHDEHQIEISINDTGQGITEETKKHLFEPFFTTKEVGKGTGLGLSLCYEIIRKQDGLIEVNSEAGKGATFTVKLPIPDLYN
ncbi:MAG TPA: ATP-binding protein [Bacillota bacterium]|nr:ATP-binding protein [Bacillota bacterium]